MKRATRTWLELNTKMAHGVRRELLATEAEDILDSDARQRAEIRALKKRLREAEAAWTTMMKSRFADTEEESMFPTSLVRALDNILKPLEEKR